MLIDIVKKGVTDRSILLRIIDSGDGTPETGVVFNTTGIDLWYRREGAAKTSITEATLSALTDAHSDGGFLHVGDGYYRFDIPDAAFATGANYVDFGGTVTGMVVIGGRVKLVNIDLEDTVRFGMTALPNAAAEASGGLYTRGTGAGQIAQSANGQVDVNLERIDNDAQSMTDLKDFADAGYDPATNKVEGVKLADTLTTYTSNTPQTGDAYARLGAPAGASVSADILVLDNLVDDLESRVGTPSNLGGGATVAANLADIEAQTDDIGAAGAGLTALATAANLATVAGYLDTEIAAIKAVTDALPANIPDSVLDEVVEGSTTLRQLLRGFASALLAKADGLDTTTATYRDLADSKDRITATVTPDGNRSAVTLDLT